MTTVDTELVDLQTEVLNGHNEVAPETRARVEELLQRHNYEAIRQAGLRVGSDVSIVGFDDVPNEHRARARSLAPSLRRYPIGLPDG